MSVKAIFGSTNIDPSMEKRDSVPYMDDSDGCESDLSTESSTDSDTNDLDRNNNDMSPLIHQKFPPFPETGASYMPDFRRSCSEPYGFQQRSTNSLLRYSASMRSNPRRSLNDREILHVSETNIPEINSNRWDSVLNGEMFSSNEEDINECSFAHQREAEKRLMYANANENNNSNTKGVNRLHSSPRVRSYDLRKNSEFRRKNRSVQLSSIRAGRGIYSPSSIQPFRERMICKDGSSNVCLKKFGRLDLFTRYSRDIYTTLIDLSWTWVIFLTAAVYIGHWIIFGLIYWLFAHLNGDDYEKIMRTRDSDPAVIFDVVNSSSTTAGDLTTASPLLTENEPCVSQVYDFVTAFLFSMESETTIGYGSRAIGTSCPAAILCLVIQCVISAIFDTWVIGMCFARLARPDARCKTILYPHNAVICTRDGKKCLIIRVANLRKSLLLSVSCRAHVITWRAPRRLEQKEGHQFMLEQKELNFENGNTTMLTAPVEYVHVIDEKSPLHSIPEKCFLSQIQNWFEIVVIVTGIVEATGMTMHAQTSFLSTEIKYKHRYHPIVSVSAKSDRYVVDFKKFHDTVPEPPLVDILEAGRVQRDCRKKSKAWMNGRFGILMEDSEEERISDDVFDRNNPQVKKAMKCKCVGSKCDCHDARISLLNKNEDINDNTIISQV